jgi:hypothetical protein
MVDDSRSRRFYSRKHITAIFEHQEAVQDVLLLRLLHTRRKMSFIVSFVRLTDILCSSDLCPRSLSVRTPLSVSIRPHIRRWLGGQHYPIIV